MVKNITCIGPPVATIWKIWDKNFAAQFLQLGLFQSFFLPIEIYVDLELQNIEIEHFTDSKLEN